MLLLSLVVLLVGLWRPVLSLLHLWWCLPWLHVVLLVHHLLLLRCVLLLATSIGRREGVVG